MYHAVLLKKHGRVYVFAPWNPEFIEALKDGLPWHARKWNAEARTWSVPDDYQPRLVEIASAFYEITIAFPEGASPQRESPSAPRPESRPAHSIQQCLSEVRRLYAEEATLGLFPPADSEPIIRAVYRARALLVHPDHAGASSTETMVRLNRAYEVLLKRCKQVAS
jgi:hypothetical protein